MFRSIGFMIIPPPTPTIDPNNPATAPTKGEYILAFFICRDSFVLAPEVLKTLLFLRVLESHHLVKRGTPRAVSPVEIYSEYSR
jgi:hypothetical protein